MTGLFLPELSNGDLAVTVKVTPQKIMFDKLNNNGLSQHAWVTEGEIETFLSSFLSERALI